MFRSILYLGIQIGIHFTNILLHACAYYNKENK